MKHAMYELAEFKSLEDAPGRFEAIVSVFGNVDYQGDRVVEGAFQNSLDKWKASGKRIPVIWSHQWGDPFAHIGSVSDAEEIPGKGLKVTGTLDTHKPFAGQVHDLLLDGRVGEFSFAYDIIKEKKAEDGANELLELNLIEVGPTLKGANPETELLAVKSALEDAAHQKAGRAISKANEGLIRTAADALGKVLESLSEEEADASKDSDAGNTLLELKARIESESTSG